MAAPVAERVHDDARQNDARPEEEEGELVPAAADDVAHESGHGDVREPEYDLLKAQDAKSLGNARYAEGEWSLAADAYTEAIMWAPPDAEVCVGELVMRVYACRRML